jgi:translation initiation factor 3 subunit F
MDGLRSTLDKLERALAQAQEYVAAVVAGRQRGSVAVGRSLSDAVGSVPRFSREELEKLVQDNQNDMMLTLYLSNLVRAHIALADRLETMRLPLV